MSRPKYQPRQQNQVRPLPSQLSRSLGKKILVAIKVRNMFIKGILRMYDLHLNLIVEDAVEVIKLRDGTKKERQ